MLLPLLEQVGLQPSNKETALKVQKDVVAKKPAPVLSMSQFSVSLIIFKAGLDVQYQRSDSFAFQRGE